MKPNERFGAQIVFISLTLVLFVVGSIAYTTGIEHGYSGKKPYTVPNNYNIDNYLIDSKILEGGIKDGKYKNNTGKYDEDDGDTRKTDTTFAESDRRSKQKFKENIQYLGRLFQNSWYIGVGLFRSNYFYGN